MIIADDEFVKVSGVILPGTFKSLEVSGSALIEEIEVEGKGKKPKQATGYEDARITIDLLLLDDADNNGKTKYDKLAIIQDLFKKSSQKKPVIHEIINEHITKRNIGRVVFKDLSSKETNKKDELIASLEFWEHEEISISTTKKSQSLSNASKAILGENYQSYLDNDKGKAPKIADKTSATPAHDIVVYDIGTLTP